MYVRQFFILLLTILIASCDNSTTNAPKTKSLNDSIDNYKHLVDSLINSDASLFDKALRMEKDSADKSIAVYQEIADRHTDGSITSYTKAPYYAKQALYRIHYLESLRFLEFIKSYNVESTDVKSYHEIFKISYIDTFFTFISKRGFEIYDANEIGNENTKLTTEELRKQLTEREGHAFRIIAQLSYIYSMPHPQYSQTDFAISTDDMTGIYVTMGGYRLSFQFDGNDMPYKLAKIESYHIDDL